MGWTHGVDFLSVAFQNRVAFAMGGTTLHAGAEMAVGGEYKSLSHTDIDVLYACGTSTRKSGAQLNGKTGIRGIWRGTAASNARTLRAGKKTPGTQTKRNK